MEFKGFPKMARLSRNCIITEKIDGTNASILFNEDGSFLVGSRTRWITPEDDNFGFARWVHDNIDELRKLGIGHHFGEWWGKGIQRGYGLDHKRFSLFNTTRWGDDSIRPTCCNVVPELYKGIFDTIKIEECLEKLRKIGSLASPFFTNPEGIVVFHEASRQMFKKTLDNDAVPKSLIKGE